MLARFAFSLVSPPGGRGKLSTLIFHRVRPSGGSAGKRVMNEARFDELLSWVANAFNVIAPDEAVERLVRGELPARALCITFDDGYADNAELALPVLMRHRLTAAFFVATDFLDGGTMWNDRLAIAVRKCVHDVLDLDDLGLGVHQLVAGNVVRVVAKLNARVKYLPDSQRTECIDEIVVRSGVEIPNDLMMTSGQVRQLRHAGMVVGGHTCSHPILASLDHERARSEIVEGKRRLEDILGERIDLFAYPNGQPGQDFRPEHARIVKDAGFKAAFTTAWGVSRRDTNLFQLPRFTPWDSNRNTFMYRLGRNLLTEAVTV